MLVQKKEGPEIVGQKSLVKIGSGTADIFLKASIRVQYTRTNSDIREQY